MSEEKEKRAGREEGEDVVVWIRSLEHLASLSKLLWPFEFECVRRGYGGRDGERGRLLVWSCNTPRHQACHTRLRTPRWIREARLKVWERTERKRPKKKRCREESDRWTGEMMLGKHPEKRFVFDWFTLLSVVEDVADLCSLWGRVFCFCFFPPFHSCVGSQVTQIAVFLSDSAPHDLQLFIEILWQTWLAPHMFKHSFYIMICISIFSPLVMFFFVVLFLIVFTYNQEDVKFRRNYEIISFWKVLVSQPCT